MYVCAKMYVLSKRYLRYIMTTTGIHVKHSPNEEIIIGKRNKSPWLIPFRPIGAKSMKNSETLDALEIICAFNKSELRLLKYLKDNVDTKKNLVTIVKKEFPVKEQRGLVTAITSLIKKKVLTRLCRERYLVNPYFFVPEKDEHSNIINAWRGANKGKVSLLDNLDTIEAEP